MLTVITQEVQDALKYFAFLKPAETITDYNYYTILGKPNAPLLIIATNGNILAQISISARTDSEFSCRVDGNLFKGICNSVQTKTIDIAIEEKTLILTAGRTKHRVARMPNPLSELVFDVPLISKPFNTIKRLRQMEQVWLTPKGWLGLIGSGYMFFVAEDLDMACSLSPTAVSFLDCFGGNVQVAQQANSLYIANPVCRGVLGVGDDCPPPFERVLAYPVEGHFTITPDEAKSLAGFGYSENIHIIVRNGELTILARSGKNESRFEKSAPGLSDLTIKLLGKYLKELVGQIRVVDLPGPAYFKAVKILDGNATTFISGLAR